MLSTYNDDSTTSNPAKGVSNKVKILSQTLLKAANLSSKKDLLNRALGASDSNKSVESDPGSKVISKQLFKNNKDGEKPCAPGNDPDKVIKNVKAKKQSGKVEVISDSSDGEELNNNLSQIKKTEAKADSDSSAESEKAIWKTQVSKSDISQSDKRNSKKKDEISIQKKLKGKKQEVISESSDSEQEHHNSQENIKKKMRQKKEEVSSSSDSESDKSKPDLKVEVRKNKSRQSRSSSRESRSSDASSSGNEKGSKQISKRIELKNTKSSNMDKKKSSKAKSESHSSSCDSDINVEKNQSKVSKGKRSKEATLPNTVTARMRKEKKGNISYSVSSSESESDNENINKKSSLKHKKTTRNSQISKPNEQKHDTSRQEVSSSSTSDSDTDMKSSNKRNKKTVSDESSSETSRNSSRSRRSSSTQKSNSDQSKSCSSVYSPSSESDSSKDIKTTQKRYSSSESSSSDSEDNKKGKKTPSSSSKLKRKYTDMKASDDSSDDDRRASKKQKQANTTPVKKVSEADKLLDNFLNENQYKLAKPKQLTPLDSLGKDEEVYLLQLSKNIDPLSLVGKTISFDGPSKLKIEDKSYISDVNTKDQCDINLMNFTNLVNLKPKGVITVQPRIKSVHSNFEMKPVNDILEIPDNLKVRHPLFGPNYEEKIKLDEDIQNKLNEIVVDIDKKHKKKSKKKRRDAKNMKDGVGNEDRTNEKDDIPDIIRLLNRDTGQAPEEQKKKKKSKHKAKDYDNIISQMQNEADSILSQMISDLEVPKKKRKNQSSQDLSDTGEINISSHSLHEPVGDDHAQPKKKKKKKKHQESIEINEQITSTSILNQDEGKVKKSKKHSSKEFIFSTSDIIQETYKKVKKDKKDKKEDEIKNRHIKNIVNSTMLTSEKSDSILQLDESCIPKTKKKKHKHKRSVETENFIDDLMKDVDASQETTPHKKKKHKKKHSIE